MRAEEEFHATILIRSANSAGFFGTDILFDVLLRNGKVDLAYALMSGEKMGSYLWMKRQGATTLYEYLNGTALLD